MPFKPSRFKRVGVYLVEETYERFKEVAEDNHRSYSEEMRQLIRKHVQEHQKKREQEAATA